MSSVLPIEVIEKITTHLSNHDKIQCLITCKLWYSHLYRVVLRKVNINCRREFSLFLSLLKTYGSEPLGRHVRKIYLTSGVGMTCEEVLLIGKYCPLLEVFMFNNWRYYKHHSFAAFRHLKQMPKLQDSKKGTYALAETSTSLTHLQLDTLLVQELLNENRLLSFLGIATQLTHLTLEGIFRINHTRARANTNLLEFTYKTWHAVHTTCPHLVSITTDNTIFTATPHEANNMMSNEIKLIMMVPQLKQLKLTSLRMEHPVWISYIAKKYPNLQKLHLEFMMGMFVSINQFTDNLNPLSCQHEFIHMASQLKKLRYLQFRGLRESHFPGTSFFKTLASTTLEHSSMAYESGIVYLPGFNLQMLEALVNRRQHTLKRLEVGMWIGLHENFTQLLKPLSLCSYLKELSLSSEDYLSFLYHPIPIDLILDACPHLIDLSLFKTAVAIDDKHSIRYNHHPLKKLSLAVSKVSPTLFEYISDRCRKLNSLVVDNCCWMPREVEMKINMPFTQLELLHISGLNLFYIPRLQGHLGGGRSVNLFSVTRIDKITKQKERYKHRLMKLPDGDDQDLSSWYHSYLPTVNQSVLRPTLIRRLYQPEVRVLKRLARFFQENHHLVRMTTSEEVYDDEVLGKKLWRHDVKHGYVLIICKSIHKLEYGSNTITWPQK